MSRRAESTNGSHGCTLTAVSDADLLVAFGCPVCLTVRGVSSMPSECCGLPVTGHSSALLGFVELVPREVPSGLRLTVGLRRWLRGSWEPEAERLIDDAWETWRAAALAALE